MSDKRAHELARRFVRSVAAVLFCICAVSAVLFPTMLLIDVFQGGSGVLVAVALAVAVLCVVLAALFYTVWSALDEAPP